MNQYLDSLSAQSSAYGSAASQIAEQAVQNHLNGLYNEKTTSEIYKQGIHQLNGLIGESGAEAGLLLGHMGYNSYKKYKSIQAKKAAASSQGGEVNAQNAGSDDKPPSDKSPQSKGLDPTTHPTIEQPQFQVPAQRAPAAPEADAEEGSGIASGEEPPRMVTSSAQTDTPVMKLKGGGLLDEGGRYRYDPNVPGMIRKPKSEGGDITNPNQDLIDADASREKYLMEQSAGARARASRRLGAGADPDDVDLPPAGFEPPRIKFANEPFEARAEATDLSIKPQYSSRQAAVEAEQKASLERYNVGQARMKQRLAERADPDIQVGRYRRGGFTVESGGRSGYNPLDTPQQRLLKQVQPQAAEPIATQTEPEVAPSQPEPSVATVKETPVYEAKVQTSDIPEGGSRFTPKPINEELKPETPSLGTGEGGEDIKPPPAKAPTVEAPKVPTVDDPKIPDLAEEGGGLGLGEILGGGLALGQLAKGDYTGAAENLGMLAGTELAESALPGLGEVLMAGTAIASFFSDLSEKAKDKPPSPPPIAPTPTMAFSSQSALDSTSYRQPMGGIGN